MLSTQAARRLSRSGAAVMLVGLCTLAAHGTERVLLRNGFTVDCSRRELLGEQTRLYLGDSAANFMDVATPSIESVTALAPSIGKPMDVLQSSPVQPRPLSELVAAAGAAHRIQSALLASVVQAESSGHANAISHAGAKGLMQLMPGTAKQLGVQDSFVPEDNLRGGTTYLDALLTRYHDDLALALAAYNAGPAAVDRYHGIPPYRETRLYVARIIREFNRRILAERTTAAAASLPAQTRNR